VRITLFTALVVSLIAGFFPLADIAALANAGTLAAFIAVTVCLFVSRHREPNGKRPFRAPMPWLTGSVAIVGCVYLFFSLPQQTQWYFLAWNCLGLFVYFGFARKNCRLKNSGVT
jgi:APA family basic amino acid/polyamine antiporter